MEATVSCFDRARLWRLSRPEGIDTKPALLCPRYEPYAERPHVQKCAGGARQPPPGPRRAGYFGFLRLAEPRRPASADWPTLAGSDEVSERGCAGSEVAGAGSGWSGTPTISSEGARADAGCSGTVPPMSWRLAQASHFSQFSCSSAMACSNDGAMPANRIMAGSAHTPLIAQSHWESDSFGVSLL